MKILTMTLLLIAISACSKNSSPATTNAASGGGNNNGGGSAFTAAQIANNWISACTAYTDPIIGSSFYQSYLSLNADGSFQYLQYMFNADNPGACATPYYFVVFEVNGTFTVGSVVSGSAQAINFTIDVTNIVPSVLISTGPFTPALATTQDAFNNDCGGTSPYCTLVSSSCTNNGSYVSGQWANTQHMTCQHYTFPNTGTNTIYNLGTYSNGTLTLGAGLEGVPGVFSPGSLPGSATVPYN